MSTYYGHKDGIWDVSYARNMIGTASAGQVCYGCCVQVVWSEPLNAIVQFAILALTM